MSRREPVPGAEPKQGMFGFTDEDRELADADPALPGLALLLDPTALRDALTARLHHTAVDRVRPYFLRYKPGKSCALLCDVIIEGRRHSVYARAEPRRKLDDLRAMVSAARPTALVGSGGIVLDDAATAVLAFPNDRRLPAVWRLHDQRTRTQLVSQLLGGAERSRHSVELIRWRPERRFVGRVTDEAGTALAAVKVLAAADYAAGRAAVGHFVSRGPLRVPRVLGSSSADRAFALEWLPGGTLADVVDSGACDSSVMEAVGRALAELHRQTPRALPALSAEVHGRALRAKAAWLGRLHPALASRAAALAERASGELGRREGELVALHGDCTVKQMLVSAGDVSVLDLDGARQGHPATDLSMLISDLERRAMVGRLSEERCAVLTGTLLEAYARESGREVARETIDVFLAASLLERSAGAFRRQKVGWRASMSEMLDRAERLLDAAQVPSAAMSAVA